MKKITATELKSILDQHNLWFAGKGGKRANLSGADLTGANLWDANLRGANLTDAILPDISWIIPGCLVQLNQIIIEFKTR